MSEERFNRIEARLDVLTAGQDQLRADVAGLKTDVAGLKTDVAELKTGQDEIRGNMAELRRHIGVLHEDVIDKIKTLSFDPNALRREFRAGIADLRAEVNERIEPIEAAIRRRRPPRR